MLGDEALHFRVEHVVSADQAQLLQQLPREERHDRSVVRRSAGIEMDRVVDLLVEHQLEHDLPRFLLRERLQRQTGVPELRGLKIVQVLEVPVVPAAESGQGNIERIDVLVRVPYIDLDDDRRRPTGTTTHRHPFERDAFALDRLDELHERRRAHHRNGLLCVGAEVHPPEAAPERLLWQDVRLR